MLCCFCFAASFINSLGTSVHTVLAIGLVLLLGIPHGAVDHVLFFSTKRAGRFTFYSFYFLGMGLVCMLWWHFPVFSFLSFLFLSAFHFGQSQFVTYGFPPFSRTVIYFTWGISILSGLIWYKKEELNSIIETYPDLEILAPITQYNGMDTVLWTSTILFIALVSFHVRDKLTVLNFTKELVFLGMLHCIFFMLPFLIGFTVYFTIFHSLCVLHQEFHSLKGFIRFLNVNKFLKMLLPFSLISILFFFLGLYSSSVDLIPVSEFLLVLIGISVLTVPHSIVMDLFYGKWKSYLKLNS